MRKKTISLLVVLSFLLTLFPMALPAMAVDYKRVSSVETVSDDAVVELNSVRAEFAKGELKGNGKSSVIISLPSDFEFRQALDGADSEKVMTAGQWVYGSNLANNISLKYDDTDGTEITGWKVDKLDGNEIKLTVDQNILDTKKVLLNIDLGAVYVDDGHEGDIALTFDVASGGFDEGSVVVGRVTDGEVEVRVVEDSNFSDKGDVTLRIKEDRAGALEKEPKSVKITLPKGFEWDDSVVGNVYDVSTANVWLVDGNYDEVKNGNFKVKVDEDELILEVNKETSSKAAYIEIKAVINVEDETKAKYGDVIAKVGGESDVAPDTLVVGTYGDYDVTVTAADPTTVYAGMLEQEIADITLEEGIKGSLVDGRAVTLTLPEWAKWGSLDNSYADGSKVKLDIDSFPGKDGQIAKFTVKNEKNDKGRSEIDLEDLEVVLSPDAPEGALEVEIAGSAGVKATVKVAEVKKPVDVKVSSSPVIGIGKADQAIGEITLTEAEGELIKEGEYLTIELPKDVDWDEYDVEVTAGDLEVGRITTTDDNILSIKIDRESDEASTIKVTGSVTAYRSVPEGRVNAEIGGSAVIEVNDDAAIKDYYTINKDKDIEISGKPAIEENEYVDGLFEDDDTVAKIEVANVGTPAPGDQKINAVFTLGSTTFTLNGEAQTMDVAPYAKNGRTYLPMRYVAKALGIKDSGILWKAGTATFISANKVVSVKLGSTTMTLNGAPVPMDVAPEIVSGRTMIPIKWIATAFDVNVTWDAATQQVTVN